MSQENVGKLHDAIKVDNPDNAANLALRYEKAMASHNDEAKQRLGDLASTIIEADKGEAFADQRKLMIDDFSQELDLVSGALESSEVQAGAFGTVEEFSKGMHFNWDVKAYQDMQAKLPEEFRFDAKAVGETFKKFVDAKVGSEYVINWMQDREGEFSTLFGHYCNGNVDQAKELADRLLADLGQIKELEKYKKDLGLSMMTVGDMDALKVTLEKNSVSLEEAARVLKELKKAGVGVDGIKLGGIDMVKYVVEAVLVSLKGEKPLKDKLKERLGIIKNISTERFSLETEIDGRMAKIVAARDKLSKFKERNPGVEMDAHIAVFNQQIAFNSDKLCVLRVSLAFNRAKEDIAMSLSNSEKGVVGTVKLDAIFKAANAESLRAFCKKEGLKESTFLIESDRLSVESEFAAISKEEANWIQKNPEVTSAYDAIIKRGRLLPEDKAILNERMKFQAKALDEMRNDLSLKLAGEHDYFMSLGVSQIDDVAEADRPYVTQRLEGYAQLIGENRKVCARLVGANSDYKLVNGKDYFSPDEIGLFKSADVDNVGKIKEVAHFLGGDKAVADMRVSSIEEMSMSPLQASLLSKETEPFAKNAADIVKRLDKPFVAVSTVAKRFNDFRADPEKAKEKGVTAFKLFDGTIRDYDKLITGIQGARGELGGLRKKLEAQLLHKADKDLSPELRAARAKVFNNAIDNIDFLLNDDKSPLSLKVLAGIEAAKTELASAREDFANKEGWKILAGGIVIAAAVAGGIVIGALGRSAGAALFTEGAIGAQVGLGAKLGIGLSSMAGTAVGATLGQRIGSELTDAMGVSDFNMSWKIEDLAVDAGTNFLWSAGFVGGARVLVGGLKMMGASESALLSSIGAKGIDSLGALQKLASPHEWYAQGAAHTAKGFLKTFGIQFGREFGEESVEGAGDAVNPILGGLLSLVNSADGMNISLSKIGMDMKKLGLSLEHGSATYNLNSPQELVANLESYFGERAFLDADVKVNPDGSVRIRVIGQNLAQSGEVTIRPADIGMTPHAEIAQVPGVDVVSGGYRVKGAQSMGRALTSLTARGFTVEMTEKGIKASKPGSESVDIAVDAKTRAEFEANLDGLNKRAERMADLATLVREGRATGETVQGFYKEFGFFAVSLIMTGCGVRETIAGGIGLGGLLPLAIVGIKDGLIGQRVGRNKVHFKGLMDLLSHLKNKDFATQLADVATNLDSASAMIPDPVAGSPAHPRAAVKSKIDDLNSRIVRGSLLDLSDPAGPQVGEVLGDIEDALYRTWDRAKATALMDAIRNDVRLILRDINSPANLTENLNRLEANLSALGDPVNKIGKFKSPYVGAVIWAILGALLAAGISPSNSVSSVGTAPPATGAGQIDTTPATVSAPPATGAGQVIPDGAAAKAAAEAEARAKAAADAEAAAEAKEAAKAKEAGKPKRKELIVE